MLRSEKELKDYTVRARDGEIGRVQNFLADDSLWTIRYMVVDTGTIIPKKKVLVSPTVLGQPNGSESVFPVELSQEQIKDSPEIDTALPVSKERKKEAFAFGLMTAVPWPVKPATDPAAAMHTKTNADIPLQQDLDTENETRLRSLNEVRGYAADGTNGSLGRITDFILDTEEWIVRYVVVKLKGGVHPHEVLLSPQWIDNIQWYTQTAYFDVDAERVESAPRFDPAQPINREYELQLYDFFGRPRS